MGDPAGIGPEIIIKALAEPSIRRAAKFIIFGMDEQLRYAADKAEIEFSGWTEAKKDASSILIVQYQHQQQQLFDF